ncbi:S8 family serine peptidase [Leptospira sp. 'Mane']|uniref:S8 family serine peptidase n=1 Tax=Leptospira sp. 'Mane' TaxID=3387407 RepID=UPI00398A973D
MQKDWPNRKGSEFSLVNLLIYYKLIFPIVGGFLLRTIKAVSILLILVIFIQCKKDKKDPLDDIFTLLLIQQFFADPVGPDPLYQNQWHLKNNGDTTGSITDEDARVESVWNQGIKGNGITYTVNDDGLDLDHEDLKKNLASDLTIDYTGKSAFYTTSLNCATSSGTGYGCHSTCVGGILAAVENNSRGGRGASPKGKIAARNILLSNSTSNNADAMLNKTVNVSISNNSWGATDNTGRLDATLSDSLWRSAIDTAIITGRSGKGTLFFWAAGNGATPVALASGTESTDNSNYDGQANYYGVFAIAAIGNNGKRASYSEEGANLLISAHSQGPTGVAITTTDATKGGGYNIGTSSTNYADTNYTNTFNGTSAATPLAAGVTGLILEANPNLTYRDVRVLLARNARKNDSTDVDWVTNGGGLKFNHKYGFGAADATTAVSAAKSWTNLGTEITYNAGGSTTNSNITDNNSTGQTNTATVTSSGIGKVEFVELTLYITTASTANAGDLYIELTSPSGTKARLAIPRICVVNRAIALCNDFAPWRFGATMFIDEPADGNWSLKIADVCTATGAGTATTTTCSISNFPTGGAGIYTNFTYNDGRTTANANTANTLTSWSLKVRGRSN